MKETDVRGRNVTAIVLCLIMLLAAFCVLTLLQSRFCFFIFGNENKQTGDRGTEVSLRNLLTYAHGNIILYYAILQRFYMFIIKALAAWSFKHIQKRTQYTHFGIFTSLYFYFIMSYALRSYEIVYLLLYFVCTRIRVLAEHFFQLFAYNNRKRNFIFIYLFIQFYGHYSASQ